MLINNDKNIIKKYWYDDKSIITVDMQVKKRGNIVNREALKPRCFSNVLVEIKKAAKSGL